MDNLERLEKIVAELPEAERVDIAEWGDHPTFRVRGKTRGFGGVPRNSRSSATAPAATSA